VSRTTILGNGDVITGWSDPSVLSGGAVAWQEDRIVAVGREEELRRAFPEAHYLDADRGLILPGLVNLHHHFYSALARGLDPGVKMPDFPAILDHLWWRLDRALDADTVRISARLAAAECVRWGVTTVFDHHASPNLIAGSLDRIAEALEETGLSGVLCYEVTDRNGREEAERGIEENLRFLTRRREDNRVRGVFGLHASFTLSDATLDEVTRRLPPGAGVHVHVAEHPVDDRFSRERFGATPVQRLERRGLLGDRALLAHGIHVEERDYRAIAESGATLIHNPESNANNGVGRLDLPRVSGLGCAVGLGTDGMSSSILGALRAAFLVLRGSAEDPTPGPDSVAGLLSTNARVAGRFLDEPLLGTLAPGAPADVIALACPTPTPLNEANWQGHLVYGATTAPVLITVARGRVLLDEGRHATPDPAEIAEEARDLAPDLWERFRALSGNTPYLGPSDRPGEEHGP
jgi:putative selenium metabolism protein SsnA